MWNGEAFVLDKRAAEVTFYSIDALTHTITHTRTQTLLAARFLANLFCRNEKAKAKAKANFRLRTAACNLQAFFGHFRLDSTRLRSCRSRLWFPAESGVCVGFCFLLTDVQPHCQFVS